MPLYAGQAKCRRRLKVYRRLAGLRAEVSHPSAADTYRDVVEAPEAPDQLGQSVAFDEDIQKRRGRRSKLTDDEELNMNQRIDPSHLQGAPLLHLLTSWIMYTSDQVAA